MKDETVWLTQAQMEALFDVKHSTISEHINNIFKEGELEEKTSVGISDKSTGGRKSKIYNLDVIISVGYRVKSNNGVIFRQWANKVLKEYLIQGYSINQKRIEILNKTISIQTNMLASVLDIDQTALVNVVKEYTKALELLDNYDHHCIAKPTGNKPIFKIDYDYCRNLIDSMKFKNQSKIFGIEKEFGKLNGILECIYQDVFGQRVYPSIEEKAVHLLYFLIKDHPFIDGCKRIAATVSLEFLNKNNILLRNGKLIISNATLVAITILIAESKPEEMDVPINIVMNFLS